MQIDIHFEFKNLLDSQNQSPKNRKNHWKRDKGHNILNFQSLIGLPFKFGFLQ